MQRITEKHLAAKINTLNVVMGTPLEPWHKVNGRLIAHEGNYHIDGAYGGWQVHQMAVGGGANSVFGLGYMSRRELCDLIDVYVRGIDAERKRIK